MSAAGQRVSALARLPVQAAGRPGRIEVRPRDTCTLLGRELTTEEAREVTRTARRLAALILLQPDLDANYQQVKAASYPWAA